MFSVNLWGSDPEAGNGDGDWERERAMQNGMLGGCDGFNETMGW